MAGDHLEAERTSCHGHGESGLPNIWRRPGRSANVRNCPKFGPGASDSLVVGAPIPGRSGHVHQAAVCRLQPASAYRLEERASGSWYIETAVVVETCKAHGVDYANLTAYVNLASGQSVDAKRKGIQLGPGFPWSSPDGSPEQPGEHVGLSAGSGAGVFLTMADVLSMWLDLRLRFGRFSSVLSRSRGDVPPMCPALLLMDGAAYVRAKMS